MDLMSLFYYNNYRRYIERFIFSLYRFLIIAYLFVTRYTSFQNIKIVSFFTQFLYVIAVSIAGHH